MIKQAGAPISSRIDRAEGRFQQLHGTDDLIRILRVQFDIKGIDVGETFEENRLAFHHRLSRQGADVAQPEHGGAIGHNPYEVATRRVLAGCIWILLNLEAWNRNAGRVGQRQIGCVRNGLVGTTCNLPGGNWLWY